MGTNGRATSVAKMYYLVATTNTLLLHVLLQLLHLLLHQSTNIVLELISARFLVRVQVEAGQLVNAHIRAFKLTGKPTLGRACAGHACPFILSWHGYAWREW